MSTETLYTLTLLSCDVTISRCPLREKVAPVTAPPYDCDSSGCRRAPLPPGFAPLRSIRRSQSEQVRSTEVVAKMLWSMGLYSTEDTLPLCNFHLSRSLQHASNLAT